MKKFFSNKYFPIGALVLAYLLIRFINLTILPIFTDESIYLYWGKFIQTEKGYWFISITDGKPPILTWIYAMLFQLLDTKYYLEIGRSVSVIYGLVSLVAVYKISEILFKKRFISVASSIFYIISPFMFVYDRLAVYDAQLTSMLLVCVYFCIKTAKTQELKYGLLWGLFLGFAMLSKPPAITFVAVTPIVFLLLTDIKKLKKNLRNGAILLIVPPIIGIAMGNLLRVSSGYAQMVAKNSQFQLPLSEFLGNPFQLLAHNLEIFNTWILGYYTLPFYIFAIISITFLIYKKPRIGLSFLILWLIPFLILAAFGRQTFPRYVVFITPYTLIPVAYLFYEVFQINSKKFLSYLIVIILFSIIFFQQIKFDYNLLTNPALSQMPNDDKNQLVTEHPSGYGLERVFDLIRRESNDKKVKVIIQGTFGLYPYAFYLEFWGNPNINIIPYWPLDNLSEFENNSEFDDAFFIIKEQLNPTMNNYDIVLKSDKPGGRYPIFILHKKSITNQN